MYNTKTITIEEDTIINNTEAYEITLNDTLLHHYCIIDIDDKCNLITRKGNSFKTVTPYETKLSLQQIIAIKEAYAEEDDGDAPAKKTTNKKTSKSTVKGKQTKKTEETDDDKKNEPIFTLTPDNKILIHKNKNRPQQVKCENLHLAIQYTKMR